MRLARAYHMAAEAQRTTHPRPISGPPSPVKDVWALGRHRQEIASGRDQLGCRELDDLAADQRGVGTGEHALVRQALQRAIIELHLDAVQHVPTPCGPGL